MNRPYQILFVISDLNVGGAQANMLRVASEVFNQGHEVIILDLQPDKRNEAFVQAKTNPQIPLLSPPFYHLSNKFWAKYFASFLRKSSRLERKIHSIALRLFFHKHRFDFINSHMSQADLFIAKHAHLSSAIRISKFCGCYNLISEPLKDSALDAWKAKTKDVFTRFDGIITLAEKHNLLLEDVGISLPTKRIYNGINLPKEIANPPIKPIRSLKCIMCARANPIKGWELAIESVLHVKSRGISISLDIVSDESTAYQKLLTKYGHEEAINFVGYHNNPVALMNGYHIGLLPSQFAGESLPNSIVEYQSAGLAAIGTDIGEIKNLIKGEGIEAGVTIPIGSNEQIKRAMIIALKSYWNNPTLLRAHMANAQILRERFDVRQTASAYLNFWSELSKSKVS